ncbi:MULTISPECIES: terminase small subunit [unclassified Enterococcus]|uniref:terminase small subunit n=1 Tax=unclassified Enterococcus TaxID=2608891 RepID=UPI002475FEED|nr:MULTISPECIES: terminase small subunit [unclassified Enterococcus]
MLKCYDKRVQKVAHKIEKVAHKKKLQPVTDNDELTEKQKLFCLYFLDGFNATKAYKRAYQCDYNTAKSEGSRNLAKPNIKKEIHRLIK